MKQLIDKFHSAIGESRIEAAVRRPSDGTYAAEYLFGYLQGKHAGLTLGLELVRSFLDDEAQRDDFK